MANIKEIGLKLKHLGISNVDPNLNESFVELSTHTKLFIHHLRICPEGVDIVLDPLGGADTKKGYNLLRPMGIIICFGRLHLCQDI